MKIFILGAISFLCSACMTITGSYLVGVYDKDGMEFNSNMAFTAEGSGIYTVRNAMCLSHPGAIVKITDLKTGKELKGESPYQCSGKAISFVHPFKVSNQIEFLNLKYKQVHKEVRKDVAIYEFTSNDEPIDKWTSLITLLYNKHMKVSPEKWVNMSNAQAVRPFETDISDGNAYAQIIFEPSKKYSYFETAVKKTFHVEKCDGLVTFLYAKKYPSTEKLKTIISDNKDVFKRLEMDTWVPACHD